MIRASAYVDISTHSLTRRLTNKHLVLNQDADISTHSLTRRLTCSHIDKFLLFLHFNSQPHKEADGMHSNMLYTPNSFQLTASQGG